MKRLKSIRDYIDILHNLGDVCYIDHEVDPFLEMAAFARRGYDQAVQAPAPLFTNIKGSKPGMRALGAPGALSSIPNCQAARVALSVGLPINSTWTEIVKSLVASRTKPKIKPKIVDTAPFKQNIFIGDDATLDIFPIGTLHEGDGGPYANTWGTIVVRSPDGNWTSWSIARVEKLDGKRMTGLFQKPQHIRMIWDMWVKIGKPMPFALCQGCEPGLPFVSAMPLEDWISESDYLGAHFGEPIEVVRCESVDLEVPASSEVVIEGYVSLVKDSLEGPFGEYQGYLATETQMQPTYHIQSISHRDNAIWPFVAEGRPVDEFHTCAGLGFSVEGLGLLQESGLPVSMAWTPFETAVSWMIITVSPDWREKLPDTTSLEFSEKIADIVWKSLFGHCMEVIYVLDDDIDPTNIKDVLWAIPTRCHPVNRQIVKEGSILPLLTCYSHAERENCRGSKVVHDGLLPEPDKGRTKTSSFDFAYPDEVRQKVMIKWKW
ncbi:UbiD family decarboxylase [Geminocystis sp. NIES-3709]|uniref:UbiD family decarboxylase n=1 Tax=Geminocystis sp. NIES-3709 TaxID=1617448 RepID=UPI0005FC4D64|nr:UbiD family decarboxylase [Geminocystis sp. NIES-3709]BAQ66587.1 3-polyprenyl-4-hydroxybenzoate carboxy-lyase [Geminocystis sp. NIES-3709]